MNAKSPISSALMQEAGDSLARTPHFVLLNPVQTVALRQYPGPVDTRAVPVTSSLGRGGPPVHPTMRFRLAPTPGAHGLSRRALARALAYIEANLGEKFSLEDVARAANVSRFHFARQFRIRTGESPMSYCLAMRIDRAKQRLAAGNYRVCEVAADLGFFDQSHFARTFRRMTGMSPSDYVRLCDEVLSPRAALEQQHVAEKRGPRG